jgi:two-component system chemotaxis response regulator CheY
MNISVLIIDDSPILRRAIRKSVIMAGVADDRIFEAGNGREALDLLGRQPVGLVLLDLHMPVMDGEQFAQAWSQSPQLKSIPVAVVSTESNVERIERLKALGVIDFLPKPFEPESLTRLIKRQIGAAA